VKISISNLAFKNHSLLETIKILEHSPIRGIEVAPTLIWDKPLCVTKKERKDIRRIVKDHGLSIVGLQSLLYNQQDLQLFGSSHCRNDCKDYLKQLIDLCADIGGTILAFGSGNNRKTFNCQIADAFSIAASFFQDLALYAEGAGILICIEPLSSKYGCDFINTADEGAHLVKLVNNPSFRLLLDTGSMLLNGESAEDMIVKYSEIIAHMHINDPNLLPPSRMLADHSNIAEKLKNISYQEWLTIEVMKEYSLIENDLIYALECYSEN
jgi:D-psicose/D-tagatose/L-ribulose 3-epimerase